MGAHPDDIEIGCAATLLALVDSGPAIEMCWAIASATDEREDEARASAADLARGRCPIDVTVGGFRESHLPYVGSAVKSWVHGLAEQVEPDVVFTHQRSDLHQDHRFLSELAGQAFRDHVVFEFEIFKYDGDLGAPGVFVPVEERLARRKVELLRRHFVSQQRKPWFDEATFEALMRLRGVECRSPTGLAEAFYCRKLVLSP